MAKTKAKDKVENNCKMEVKGDILTITVDLSEDLGDSGTGRSVIVAKSEPQWQPVEDADGVAVRLFVVKRKSKDKK